MSWLIDTNVLSALRKGPRADANVMRWWQGVAEHELFLSVLVLGEIRKGAEAVRGRDPVIADALGLWLSGLARSFAGRVLPVDSAVAEAWGHLSAARTLPVIDGLMAATALMHDLTLVTRNVRHVEGLGVRVLDPFAE